MKMSLRARIPRAMHIAFLIRSLEVGGAEGQLVNLATGLRQRGWAVTVLVLYPGGGYEGRLRETGVTFVSLGKRSRLEVFRVLLRLKRWWGANRVDVLHSYLTVSNILAATVGLGLPALRVVWGVRATALDLRHYDRLVAFSEWLAPILS